MKMEPPVTPTAVPYVGLSPDSLLEQTELPTVRLLLGVARLIRALTHALMGVAV